MNKKVCAVIVTYKDSPQIEELLSTLLDQVLYIYIIDNGSDSRTLDFLQKYLTAYPNTISITYNQTNLGVATAQNQGIRQAMSASFDWIVLLDNDSKPETDMVSKMFFEYEKQNDSSIGIIAPRLLEKNISVASRHLVPLYKIGFKRRVLNTNDNLLNVVTANASGSMVKVDVFQSIGLMREGFFIDYVDHEFCVRAYTNGYKIMVVGSAFLHHKQGNKRYENILGVVIKTSNYNSQRYYHIFRNRMFFLRLYGMKLPFLIAHELFACALDILRIISGEDDKRSKLTFAAKGLKHGVCKKIP